MDKSFLAPVMALAIIAGAAAPALAAGASDAAPGRNKDALLAVAAGTGSPTPGGEVTTLGGAISGWFFGNTSNAGVDGDAPDRGHGVTPSISPGPSTVGGGFYTLGQAIQDNR